MIIPLLNSAQVMSGVCALAMFVPQSEQADQFLLVRRSMDIESIRLTAITEDSLVHLPPDNTWENISLDDCVALIHPTVDVPSLDARNGGLLLLSDGQRLPGEMIVDASAEPTGTDLLWNHPWLGQINIPLEMIDTVLLTATSSQPKLGKAGDVISLANGDLKEGLILSFSDPVSIEVQREGKRQEIDIPLNLITSVRMVAPRRESSGRRIWFDDGTVLDVETIIVGDDGYLRFGGSSLASGTQPTRVGLSQIAAVLFDPDDLIPLASLTPARIEGPPTRFVLPEPRVIDPDAPLGLSAIEFSGPIVVRYSIPRGCDRFLAVAELPTIAREWGDFDLVVRSDDVVVFESRLNGENPDIAINTFVTGRELTIELTEGSHGPIQDQLILIRAMLLK